MAGEGDFTCQNDRRALPSVNIFKNSFSFQKLISISKIYFHFKNPPSVNIFKNSPSVNIFKNSSSVNIFKIHNL